MLKRLSGGRFAFCGPSDYCRMVAFGTFLGLSLGLPDAGFSFPKGPDLHSAQNKGAQPGGRVVETLTPLPQKEDEETRQAPGQDLIQDLIQADPERLDDAPVQADTDIPADTEQAGTDIDIDHVVMRQLNQQFAGAVVIPTYVELVAQTQQLAEAGESFEADPNEDSLATFRQAWLDSVSAWARSSAFAFGPVHSLGHSTALESPADGAGIDKLLAESVELEADEFEEIALLPSMEGFEAIAYLLYGAENQSSEDFSVSERRYLKRLSRSAHDVSGELLAAWQQGQNGAPPYSSILASAGQTGNGAYLSVESGAEEIVRGLINCLDGIVHEELPGMTVEATANPQFSTTASGKIALEILNSRLQGTQIAYLGTARALDSPGAAQSEPSQRASASPAAAGLSLYIRAESPGTDTQIQRSLERALESVELALAAPSDANALNDALQTAQTSLSETQTLLESDVLPLTQN